MFDTSPEHRQRLDPHLERIKQYVIKKLAGDRDIVWTYLRYIGLNIVQDCNLDANLQLENAIRLRDWIIIISDGIFMNVARKLKRRMQLLDPPMDMRFGHRILYNTSKRKGLMNLIELDGNIGPLTWEINSISREEPEDIAFVGLCGYSLTSLGPALTMEAYGNDFNRDLIQSLVFFWRKVADDFYEEAATPYEEKQRLINGDCKIFALIDERLKVTAT